MLRKCLVALVALCTLAWSAASFAGDPPDDGGVRYIEIPLSGSFGKELLPKGVEQALDRAVKEKVQYAIFTVKSGGGAVWAAKSMAEAIQKFDGQIYTVALIEDALSATLWPTMSCDAIFMTPTARIGAAVAFSKEKSTGAAAVDAKFNSAFAAQLAAVAESKKRSPLLVRAMVLPEVQVFAIKQPNGTYKIVDTQPSGLPPDQVAVLSDREGILTMTGTEAAKYGFAYPIKKADLDSLRTELRVDQWTSAGTYGKDLQKENVRRAEALIDKARKVDADVEKSFKVYKESRPETLQYDYYRETGKFTPGSQKQWTEATDRAIAALGKFKTDLNQWLTLKKQAADIGLEPLFDDGFERKDLVKTTAEIDKILTDLRRDRGRTSPPPGMDRK